MGLPGQGHATPDPPGPTIQRIGERWCCSRARPLSRTGDSVAVHFDAPMKCVHLPPSRPTLSHQQGIAQRRRHLGAVERARPSPRRCESSSTIAGWNVGLLRPFSPKGPKMGFVRKGTPWLRGRSAQPKWLRALLDTRFALGRAVTWRTSRLSVASRQRPCVGLMQTSSFTKAGRISCHQAAFGVTHVRDNRIVSRADQ